MVSRVIPVDPFDLVIFGGTGDLARRMPGGSIQLLGRQDGQVKLRGFRVELAEIEAVLLQEPGVEQAVVTLQKGIREGQLVAYCRISDETRDPEPRLRARLARTLPAYMIPAGFVTLDRFPLNANGKVDRKALPPLDTPAAQAGDNAPAIGF